MKNIKKVMAMIMIVAVLFSGVVFGEELAQVIITTTVGETVANSGIRVVESYTGDSATEFDTAFFSAGSAITLVSGVDTSLTGDSGEFVVMVRRPTSETTVKVTVSGTAMASGTSTIPYKIKGSDDVVYVSYISGEPATATSYAVTTVVDGILRDAKTFTYNIPVSASAPLGTYSATVTFTLTVN